MVERLSPETETLKRNEVLVFDDGTLTVKMSGHGKADGWATIAFNEKQFELDDEGYQIVEIPPSELFELRDFLNRVLPANRPGDQKSGLAQTPGLEPVAWREETFGPGKGWYYSEQPWTGAQPLYAASPDTSTLSNSGGGK